MSRAKTKFISFLYYCLMSFSLLLLLLLNTNVYSQSDNNSSIDFEVVDEKFSSALYRLASKTNLNFSYDAGDSLFMTKINYSATNKQPLLILDELLSKTDHTYKQIGNQLVIYKDKSKVAIQSNSGVAATGAVLVSTNNIEQSNNRITETITDTIFITDTVYTYQVDTLRVNDTIYIDKEIQPDELGQEERQQKIKYFNANEVRRSGWTAAVSMAPLIANLSLGSEQDAFSFRNFSFGLEASKNIDRFNVSAGLKLTHFSEKYNNTYNKSEGGYFVTDTIDEYYTISEMDTSWFYVTDSSWEVESTQQYNYDVYNRIGYLEFFAALSFDYYKTQKLGLYIKAGFQTSVLIYKEGIASPTEDKPTGVNFADLNFSQTAYSVLIGTGIKYRISDRLDFNSELYYFKYFNDLVIDYPSTNKINGLGLKLGLIYYF